MTDTPTYSHVGVTVPDVRAAIEWYQRVCGYYLLAGPLEVLEDDSPLGRAYSSFLQSQGGRKP